MYLNNTQTALKTLHFFVSFHFLVRLFLLPRMSRFTSLTLRVSPLATPPSHPLKCHCIGQNRWAGWFVFYQQDQTNVAFTFLLGEKKKKRQKERNANGLFAKCPHHTNFRSRYLPDLLVSIPQQHSPSPASTESQNSVDAKRSLILSVWI